MEPQRNLVDVLKVLADVSRLRILGLLAEREHAVDELARVLDLKAPTVSHHLKRLRDLDLVSVRPVGTQRFYALDQGTLQRLARTFLEPKALIAASGEMTYSDRVLRTYLIDGRLKKIPAQRKKRNVVLEHLAAQLDRGRTYREREVNEIIKGYHDDFCTLRRELVMARLVTRDAGIYTRTARDTVFDPQGDEVA